jgi:hypothetical protein
MGMLVYGVRWAECERRSSLRAPQRNRNELGETTVNKTWRKHLPWLWWPQLRCLAVGTGYRPLATSAKRFSLATRTAERSVQRTQP